MNILLMGDCDNGGASWFFAHAINRHTKHEARAIRGYQSYLQYPHDLLGPSAQDARELVAWADVVHVRDRPVKVAGGIPPRKPLVITYTGRHFRKEARGVFKAARAGAVVTFVTPDMGAFCKGIDPIWLPSPREDLSHLWRPPAQGFALCQAPTSRSAKHTETVIAAAKQAGVPLDVVEGVPYAECLARKGKAHATVDQLKYGYGNNAVEAWAMGQPVMSGFQDGRYRAALLELCGSIPFAEARPTAASVRAVIERLRDDQAYRREIAERGRDHFWRFHYAPVAASRAIGIYKLALGRKG